MLSSVISVFYYLRIVVSMFMAVNEAEFQVPQVGLAGMAAMTLAAIGTFYLGVLPARLMDLAAQSISTIF